LAFSRIGADPHKCRNPNGPVPAFISACAGNISGIVDRPGVGWPDGLPNPAAAPAYSLGTAMNGDSGKKPGRLPACRTGLNTTSGMDLTLKIVIVDESPVRSAILEEGLREAGFTDVVCIAEMTNLLARIYQIDPDVILIDLENPSRDVLEQMFQVSRIVKRPIAMFVDQSDTASIQASVDAGVASYIVDGLKKERIKYILDTCISRFNAFAKLQEELDRTKNALEERKIIDRAKGILMSAKKLTEDEAYALLRSTAMKENKKIAEIAQSVITASEMFK
jgi:response regulator NasT